MSCFVNLIRSASGQNKKLGFLYSHKSKIFIRIGDPSASECPQVSPESARALYGHATETPDGSFVRWLASPIAGQTPVGRRHGAPAFPDNLIFWMIRCTRLGDALDNHETKKRWDILQAHFILHFFGGKDTAKPRRSNYSALCRWMLHIYNALYLIV